MQLIFGEIGGGGERKIYVQLPISSSRVSGAGKGDGISLRQDV